MLSSSPTGARPEEKGRHDQKQRLRHTHIAVSTCTMAPGTSWGPASTATAMGKLELCSSALLVLSKPIHVSGEGKESETLGLSEAAPDHQALSSMKPQFHSSRKPLNSALANAAWHPPKKPQRVTPFLLLSRTEGAQAHHLPRSMEKSPSAVSDFTLSSTGQS